MSNSTAFSKATSVTAKREIARALKQVIDELGVVTVGTAVLEQPAEAERGDLASPVALQLFRTLTPEQRVQFPSPLQLAAAIAEGLLAKQKAELENVVSSVSAVAPGFINFTFSQQALLEEVLRLVTQDKKTEPELPPEETSASSQEKSNVVIEYVSPNTNKPLHIGHVRNAAIGFSLSKIRAAGGSSVQKAIIFNDRGLHIMKSCWGYMAAGRLDATWNKQLRAGELSDSLTDQAEQTASTDWQVPLSTWRTNAEQWLTPEQMDEPRLRKSDHFIGFWYQLAERFAENEGVSAHWSQMLQCWEDESHPSHAYLRSLWLKMNGWFYEGFEQTRQRFGFGFDEAGRSYESAIYQKGKELVVAAADQGILERLPDGAITARLESAGLPDKILLRRDGTGIYMTFDIELTRQRTASNAQHLIWVVGSDQKLYFQQLFTVAEKLGYGEKNRYHHLAYGMVRLPEGKMSSRKGLVLYADDILELAVNQAKVIMDETGSKDHLDAAEFERVAEAVGIGAVKWTMLSVDALSEITFDVATSVSFKGFAGPYVQYTHARCQSVLRQAKNTIAIDFDIVRSILTEQEQPQLAKEEIELLRTLFTYYETLRHSSEKLAPHLLCSYLYELCQRFNTFYAVCPIVSDESLSAELKQLRLVFTEATATILADGLELLGLTAVERM